MQQRMSILIVKFKCKFSFVRATLYSVHSPLSVFVFLSRDERTGRNVVIVDCVCFYVHTYFVAVVVVVSILH